jgi:hypothetical protein
MSVVKLKAAQHSSLLLLQENREPTNSEKHRHRMAPPVNKWNQVKKSVVVKFLVYTHYQWPAANTDMEHILTCLKTLLNSVSEYHTNNLCHELF